MTIFTVSGKRVGHYTAATPLLCQHPDVLSNGVLTAQKMAAVAAEATNIGGRLSQQTIFD